MSPTAASAYAQTPRSAEERDRLVEDYLPLVHHVIGRLSLRLPSALDRDDLYSVGVLGLISAAESYNPQRGAAFKTHAFVNIRGAILDELRKHDVMPRSRRDRLRLIGQADRQLAERLGRPATPEELANFTGLKVEQVEGALAQAHGVATLSLDDARPGEGDDAVRLIDSLRLPSSPDPAREAERRELKITLAKAIEALPERERRVVILYYVHDLRLKEIGEILSVTESRVSQLHARAIRQLNQSLAEKSVRTTA